MLKENALRKKLQEIGIPSWGSKDLLKRRHIEWLNIYNSNCDADDSMRKSKRLLMKELDEWEQTQGGRADSKESKIMKKDFDGTGHMKSHKSDFDDLIARARQKRATPKVDGADDSNKPEAITTHPDPPQSTTQHSHNSNPSPSALTHGALTSHGPPNPQNPYENNESALASIRAKVQAANHAPSSIPSLHTDSSMESARRRGSASEEGMQNPFGSPNRKMSMFALPGEPVKDVDSNTTIL